MCLGGEASLLPGGRSPRFVNATVDHYADTGEWPTVRLLDNRMAELDDPADASKEAKRLPRWYGRRRGDKVAISVRGIYRTEPNHQLLDDFELALRLTARRYKRGARRVEATVSVDDLIEEFGFDVPRARRALGLLETESLLAPGPPGEETMVIAPRIRPFLRVRSVEKYVEKRKWLDRRRRFKRLACKPFGIIKWFFAESTSNGARIVTSVLAALLVAAAIWGLHQLPIGSDGDRATRATPADQQPPAPASRY